jgi:hypothetical protein
VGEKFAFGTIVLGPLKRVKGALTETGGTPYDRKLNPAEA